MKNPLITQVDVRKCKSKDNKEGEAAVKSLRSAVAEVAKYSVKSVDYLIPNDPELTDDIVFTLSAALNGKRLCSFSGVFNEARKKLNLDDCENGDLIDKSLSENNIILVDEFVRKAYDRIFGEAVAKYNSKQQRSDRRIENYYKIDLQYKCNRK